MASFTQSSGEVSATWSRSADEVSSTWSQSFQEVAASWYSFESVSLGFIFWEGFDDSDNNWEDMTTSPLYPFAALNWEDMG